MEGLMTNYNFFVVSYIIFIIFGVDCITSLSPQDLPLSPET